MAQLYAAVNAYKRPVPTATAPPACARFNGLTLGLSTGFVTGRGHYAGLPDGSTVHLSAAGVCKNI
jgi:hypothetical protein